VIRRLGLYEGSSYDPYENLAAEETLLNCVGKDCCILYLWQNKNTVVIGRNQNPWKECRTALLEEEGGHLARRLSGGGAVFHDLGNLNFTFLLPSDDYDLDRQTEVILRAVRSLGVPAVKTGRNDLTAAGRKFSGNAFYHHGGRSYHHGTLLVDADIEKMGRYLQPSPLKLRAKGVDSVHARVGNLRELQPDLTVENLKDALRQAFGEVYNLPIVPLEKAALDREKLRQLTERNRSWQWNYGQRLPFDLSCEGRFDWGEARLELRIESGVIRNARVYTDAMDWELAQRLETALTGCRLAPDELKARLCAETGGEAEDVCRLLTRRL